MLSMFYGFHSFWFLSCCYVLNALISLLHLLSSHTIVLFVKQSTPTPHPPHTHTLSSPDQPRRKWMTIFLSVLFRTIVLSLRGGTNNQSQIDWEQGFSWTHPPPTPSLLAQWNWELLEALVQASALTRQSPDLKVQCVKFGLICDCCIGKVLVYSP